MPTLYTIGHSTHPLAAFAAILQAAGIERLVDIRTVPRSRTNPQFNQDTLPAALAAYRIDYEHLAALGGLRGKSKTIPPETNGFWENDSFHHYADYALTDAFRQGLETLIQRAQAQRCAIMCSEAVWWRCHRRIVSDYLLARGIPVRHLMGPGHDTPASLTRGAAVQADGSVHYPPRPATAPPPANGP
ncbi:DUF488 family protein [Castellaniella hirudinis]|uniref:DUF488 domain-containing protein n=1 Tax=Castellaniella hirudinis TaxID=1144617 RepID=UPI0039C30AB4